MIGLAAASAANEIERLRPRFHYLPPINRPGSWQDNWINDPNGPFVDPATGLCHLFAQFGYTVKRWWHAVSTDCVRWTHLGVALAPDEDFDCGGIFSGSATLVDGQPILSYSVVCNKRVVLAMPANRSDPLLSKWTKRTTAIAGPGWAFRDPTTAWRSVSGWRMGVGCYGQVCLFKSADFATWEAAGALYHAGGGTVECPDFFPMPPLAHAPVAAGSKDPLPLWVLKVSPQGINDRYTAVRYNTSDDSTAPVASSAAVHGPGVESQQLDYGMFYASKSMEDALRGERVLWGWVAEEAPQSAPNTTLEWQGTLSIPRTIHQDPRNASRLVFHPTPAVETLRANATRLHNVALIAGGTIAVARGVQLDLVATFELLPGTSIFEVGLQVLAGPLAPGVNVTLMGDLTVGGELNAKLVLQGPPPRVEAPLVEALLVSNRSAASDEDTAGDSVRDEPTGTSARLLRYSCSPGCSGPFTRYAGETALQLRVLVDRSIVEAFAHGGRAAATKRVYPAAEDVLVSLISRAGAATASVDAYAMKDAKPLSAAQLREAVARAPIGP